MISSNPKDTSSQPATADQIGKNSAICDKWCQFYIINFLKTGQLTEKPWRRGLGVKNGGTFNSFREEEICKPLAENLARTARIQLHRRHLQFGEYLWWCIIMNWVRIVSSGGFLLFLLLLRCLYLNGEYLKRLVTARCLRLLRFTLLYIADSDKFMLLRPSCEQCPRNCYWLPIVLLVLEQRHRTFPF